MTKRVIHQEYLEAWLRGENVQATWSLSEDWSMFNLETHDISYFNNKSWSFRITPKTVEVAEDSVVVSLTDFYAEYDNITTANFRESFLEDLIAKYLPRGEL